ncbi:hypothetical protein LguiA_015101 [Lonicera macranthoides]
MTENPELGEMDYRSVSSSCEMIEEKGTQKISMSNQINRLQHGNIKSDSFLVDMERLSHPIDVSSPNSRITLQRSLTRKGSQRGGEKKINSSNDNNRDNNSIVPTSSPRAAILGASTPETSMVVTVSPTEHAINPQIHHQINITTGNTATTTTSTTTTEHKLSSRRLSFRRSSPSRTIDPRRILFFFATLSSVGSILLIYFTLSMGKLGGDDNAVNW